MRTTSASPRGGAATATRTARTGPTRRTAPPSRARKTSSTVLPGQSRALTVLTRASSATERPIAMTERTRGMLAVRSRFLLRGTRRSFSTNLFFISAKTLCGSLGCEHECKSSLEGGVCTCPQGKKLANDTKTCIGEIAFTI